MKDNNNVWMWIFVAVCVVLLLGLFGFSGFRGYGMGGMMYGSYGYGMMFFGWITWVLVIALIIAAIYWLVKSANKR